MHCKLPDPSELNIKRALDHWKLAQKNGWRILNKGFKERFSLFSATCSCFVHGLILYYVFNFFVSFVLNRSSWLGDKGDVAGGFSLAASLLLRLAVPPLRKYRQVQQSCPLHWPENLGKSTAQECKKSTSGWYALLILHAKERNAVLHGDYCSCTVLRFIWR